ncbi:MAG: LamG-like jellyroll fold domain-containing protein [Microthrixaceae bacterium]
MFASLSAFPVPTAARSFEFWAELVDAEQPGGLPAQRMATGGAWLTIFGPSPTTGEPVVELYENSTAGFVAVGTFPAPWLVADGRMHHFVINYDGTTVSVSVDAVVVGSKAHVLAGADLAVAAPNGSGRVDEVALYPSVLSPTDIVTHRTLGVGETASGSVAVAVPAALAAPWPSSNESTTQFNSLGPVNVLAGHKFLLGTYLFATGSAPPVGSGDWNLSMDGNPVGAETTVADMGWMSRVK